MNVRNSASYVVYAMRDTSKLMVSVVESLSKLAEVPTYHVPNIPMYRVKDAKDIV